MTISRKDIAIRKESVADIDQINVIHRKAFLHHWFSRGNEDLIINTMRHENGITLSLVAEYKNMLIGNVIFSLLIVEGHLSRWNLLGPLAVLPEFQRQGIGSMLVHYGISLLKSMLYDGCVLFGDPLYYYKFGFTRANTVWHENIPQEFILEQSFSQKQVHGLIRFHQAFDI